MSLNEMASFLKTGSANESKNSEDTGAAFVTASSIEEAKEKAIEMARSMGLPESEIEKLRQKISSFTEAARENEVRKFGVYSHPALMGMRTQKESEAKTEALAKLLNEQPDAMLSISLKEVVAALTVFKGSYEEAKSRKLSSEAHVCELGAVLMYALLGLRDEKLEIREIFRRLGCMWDGDGPGELDFKPVFDEDYPGIAAAWLAYKNKEIDDQEFRARVEAVRPSAPAHGSEEDTCGCIICKTRRGEI